MANMKTCLYACVSACLKKIKILSEKLKPSLISPRFHIKSRDILLSFHIRQVKQSQTMFSNAICVSYSDGFQSQTNIQTHTMLAHFAWKSSCEQSTHVILMFNRYKKYFLLRHSTFVYLVFRECEFFSASFFLLLPLKKQQEPKYFRIYPSSLCTYLHVDRSVSCDTHKCEIFIVISEMCLQMTANLPSYPFTYAQ